MLVDFNDFKSVLAQCFQWYQASIATIKQITKSEQTKNLFDDGQQDKFETGFRDDKAFSANSKGDTFDANFAGFDTGGMQPDAAMLREFGLPVPLHMNEDFSMRASMNKNETRSSLSRRTGRLDHIEDINTLKQKHHDAANEFRAGSQGDVYADTFGRFKFREHDQNGTIIPNQYLDGIDMPGEKSQFFTGQFSDFYQEK